MSRRRLPAALLRFYPPSGTSDRWKALPKDEQNVNRLRAQVRKMTEGEPSRQRGKLLLLAAASYYTDPEEFVADVREAIDRGQWTRVPI